jgi:hypothetical protein
MKMEKADGPKTELVGVSSRMQQSIEDMIASFSEGVADCIEGARNVVPESAYDHRRSSERSDASKLMTTTAELLSSIAKLKGEFRQSYHVTRVSEPARKRAPTKSGWSGDEAELLTQKEYDALSEEEQIDYERWTEGLPPRFGGWRRPKLDKPEPAVDGEIAALAEEVERGLRIATTPPPENSGSNADAENS